MNPYIKLLKEYMDKSPIQYGYKSVDSLLGMLYYCYTEHNPLENATIHYQLQKLYDTISKLTEQEKDKVIDLTVEFCAEYSRQAFSEGIRIGMQLASEIGEYGEQ